jgi:hypothetical protein
MRQDQIQAEADLRRSVDRCLQALLAQRDRIDRSSTDDERQFHELTLSEIRHAYDVLSQLWEDALRKLDE